MISSCFKENYILKKEAKAFWTISPAVFYAFICVYNLCRWVASKYRDIK